MNRELNILIAGTAMMFVGMVLLHYLPFPMPRDTLWFTLMAGLGIAAACLIALSVLTYRDMKKYEYR